MRRAVSNNPLKLILFCIAIAIAYGIMQDMVTAHLCVEYFTIGHPPIFGTGAPVLLALGWGVVATWWVGLLFGGVLVGASRIGFWPRYPVSKLYRPVRYVMLATGVVALCVGIGGHIAAANGWVWLTEPLASQIPPARHILFLTDLWVHTGAYAVAAIGAIILCLRILYTRIRGVK